MSNLVTVDGVELASQLKLMRILAGDGPECAERKAADVIAEMVHSVSKAPNAKNVRNHQRLLQEERNRNLKLRDRIDALRQGINRLHIERDVQAERHKQDQEFHRFSEGERAGYRIEQKKLLDRVKELEHQLERSERLRSEGK